MLEGASQLCTGVRLRRACGHVRCLCVRLLVCFRVRECVRVCVLYLYLSVRVCAYARTDYIAEISSRYTLATYSLLRNNCNNFTNEVSLFLTGAPIPDGACSRF